MLAPLKLSLVAIVVSLWIQFYSSGGRSFAASFSGATVVAIAGDAHKLQTADLIVQCWDNSVPRQLVEPDSVSIHPVTLDVTVTFTAPQDGRCVLK